MSNTTFAVLVVGAGIVGSIIGYKAVEHLPDRISLFGRTLVRKNKG
jgi:L-2-hydroxyglutarate oxidase LhgO